MTKLLEDKVALVTGGNSGIGKAAAISFARHGAKVVVAARRADEGQQTVDEISALGGEAMFVPTDVAVSAEVEEMVRATVARFGQLDVAFNNAGTGSGGPLHMVEEEEWDRAMSVNLKGVWLCMKYQVAQMLKQGKGAIVNNSSTAGLTGFVRSPVYSASKHGVIGLTKSAALQYINDNIRINVICPGVTITPMIEQAYSSGDDVQAWFESQQPTGRGGTPKEVAEAAAWLCSDTASFVTGVAMPIDGGMLAGLW